MEKLNFNEVLALAKNFYLDFDCLLIEDINGNLIDRFGKHVTDDKQSIIKSDKMYDLISAYIKVLNEVLSNRPLPF